MHLKTNKLLLLTAAIIAAIFVVATIPEFFGLTLDDAVYGAALWTIVFGLNVAGLAIGLVERKVDSKKARIGIIGHSLLILFFLAMVSYSIYTVENPPETEISTH